MQVSHIKKSAVYLAVKTISGIVFGVGAAIGIYAVYSFQTSTVTPTSTGTGTADSNNSSKNFPLMTRTSTGSYDRNTMSLEAISKMLLSMGALVDDPFPGSLVATSSITKQNIVRHAASGTKIWTRCFRASTDGDLFSTLRTKCSGKWPVLFLSLASNGTVLEGYINVSLPASAPSTWVGTAPATYIAFSAPTGANNIYVSQAAYGYTFYDQSASYHCFGYTSNAYAYCIAMNDWTVKNQYTYTTINYFAPTTFTADAGMASANYNTISEVEVWY